MEFKDILETLAQGEDLTPEMAEFAFAGLFNGELSPAQSGAFLMGLRAKGETAQEVTAAVNEALKHARLMKKLPGKSIDTCGTGGDGKNSFNCSTTVALYLADMGYKVVKHGNRAMSSSSGSADIIEAMGMPLDLGPDEAGKALDDGNFVFLFAQIYHPAFKHVGPVRKELGIRNLFNIMGPLLNPARPTHQIMGIPSPAAMPLVAEVLKATGIEKAAVVYGAGGFDELTPFGENKVIMVDGDITEMVVDSEKLGFPMHKEEDVAVTGKEDSLAKVKDLLAGKGTPAMKDMVALNLAMALHILDGDSLEDCVSKARAKVDQGVSEAKNA